MGVVVNHIHDHTDAGLVQGLDHLLVFPDADFTVVRIGGVAAFGHVIVFGIVTPVELIGGIGLVHSRVVVNRQQMHVGDAQFLQIVHTDALAVFVYKAGFGECQILAFVGRGRDLVGEVPDMNFPDNCLGVVPDGILQRIVSPAFRIGLAQIHNHTPVAVDTGGLGIGVHCFLGTHSGGDGIGVISAVTAVFRMRPDTLFTQDHVHRFIGIHAIACFKQIQNDPGRGGGPDLEGGLTVINGSTQIVAVIVIVRCEILAVKNIDGDHFLFSKTVDHNLIAGGQIQIALYFNVAGRSFRAQRGKIRDGDLFSVFKNLDLGKVGNGSFGV